MEPENYTFKIEGPKLKADIEVDEDTIDVVSTIVTLIRDRINFIRLQPEPELEPILPEGAGKSLDIPRVHMHGNKTHVAVLDDSSASHCRDCGEESEDELCDDCFDEHYNNKPAKEPFDPFELKTTEDGTFILKCGKCGFGSTDGKLFERMDKCLKCAEKTEGNKVYSSSTEKKAELEDKDSLSTKLEKGLDDLKEDNYTQVRPKKRGRKKGPFEDTIAGKITILFQKMKTLRVADILKAYPDMKYTSAAKQLSMFKAEGKAEKMPNRYWVWKGEVEKSINNFQKYQENPKQDMLSEQILAYLKSKPKQLIDMFVIYRDLDINQEDEQKVWGKVIKLSRENDEVFTYKGSFNKRYVSFGKVTDLPRIVKLMSKPAKGLGDLF